MRGVLVGWEALEWCCSCWAGYYLERMGDCPRSDVPTHLQVVLYTGYYQITGSRKHYEANAINC